MRENKEITIVTRQIQPDGAEEKFEETDLGTVEETEDGTLVLRYTGGGEENLNCVLRIKEDRIEIEERQAGVPFGKPRLSMVLVPGEKNPCLYSMPYGDLNFSAEGKRILIRRGQTGYTAAVEYILHYDASYRIDCRMTVKVR